LRSDKKICAVIPARYDSTRFPGKPLALLGGKPVIEHVYKRAAKADMITEIMVATDDERIFNAVIEFGGKAVMTSKNHVCGTDRIAEACAEHDCEYVINVQGDEPLIDPQVIDSIAETLVKDNECMAATPIALIKNEDELINPNIVKVVRGNNGYAIYFSRYPIPFIRDAATKKEQKFYKHIGLYGFNKNFLLQLVKYPSSSLEKAECLEQLRILENGFRIKTVLTDYEAIGVDTLNALKELEKLL